MSIQEAHTSTNLPMYFRRKYGPISTGRREVVEGGSCNWVHGIGRIVEVIFSTSKLHDDRWITDDEHASVDSWIREEWDGRILIHHDDPQLDQFKTLHELGSIDINITPEEYGASIEQSCKFLYDTLNRRAEEAGWTTVSIHHVRMWEHDNHSSIHGHYPDK